ncbi:hypothetical protein SAMN04488072_109166 [Lentibacillus halodurans]|uniref:Uncharacterized protein n=1 Tax=Lentibacillus halodurans TaxID=237679 RepID=A0A1I0Z4P8_9BACI|nr:hypothetical protein [Lentibacillus halodurans]SFB20531.1 hypothetical protein SAMN04488072_109166 [Lentibacillus halodurans]
MGKSLETLIMSRINENKSVEEINADLKELSSKISSVDYLRNISNVEIPSDFVMKFSEAAYVKEHLKKLVNLVFENINSDKFTKVLIDDYIESSNTFDYKKHFLVLNILGEKLKQINNQFNSVPYIHIENFNRNVQGNTSKSIKEIILDSVTLIGFLLTLYGAIFNNNVSDIKIDNRDINVYKMEITNEINNIINDF